ncbi:MAG: cation transporter [Acidimicrobiia bacterium]|nr:cation transporter [Acidimicrobiia bacterium]
MGGDHGHAGHTHGGRAAQGRALWIALGVNLTFLVVELGGGFAFNSLALLADAVHMLTDVAGLAIALIGQSLLARPATDRHTYGLQRAEVLAAQANGLLLVGAAIWIAIEAVGRIGSPEPVAGGGVVVVAACGLVANLVSAAVLLGHRDETVNLAGAFWHMIVDAAGSIGAIVAGVAVLAWDATWVDPVMSMLIGVLALWSGWRLLADTTRILLEGTPRGLSPEAVAAALLDDDRIEDVHHLHLWNLASDTPAMTVHVLLRSDDRTTMHEAQNQREELREMLDARFGIRHATIEMECHACDVPGTKTTDRG